MYEKNPMRIEEKSMEIIDESLSDVNFTEEELQIVKRMIHTTGDVEYRHIIDIRNNFIDVFRRDLKNGLTIYTDTRMAEAGINKRALKKLGISIRCYVDDERAFSLSKEKGTTRSAIGVELAVEDGIDIFVFGNAPTALFRLLELYKEGKASPKLIVGVPVGFVGAAESKEALRETDIPQISTIGPKGGSNVASSIVNAILYMTTERC
ncbi:MAG: precorrin-8X methylmutase [Tissierellia bacterium]|nr:precorrin-8X methylmutase [Tissierellia bacterium]